jgi:aryl-alcohol dehydrogenase-like predicted oxidoreductase
MIARYILAVPGTPLQFTRLGFGCARLFAGIEARGSHRLIEAALGLGIRHFDTAPSYAWGQSELVLGEVLASAKDVTIATKVGLAPVAGGPSALSTAYRLVGRPLLAHLPRLKSRLIRRAATSVGSPPAEVGRRPLHRDEIHASLESSLRRLRRDRIDLLLIHEPDHIVLDEPTLEIFRDLQRREIIGAFGLGYARAVDVPPRFGQIVQAQFSPTAPAATPNSPIARIWHGVLRAAESEAADSTARAKTRISQVLTARPGDGIVFSASTVRQIRDVAGATTLS